MKFFEPEYKYHIHPQKGLQVATDVELSSFNVDLLNIGDLRAPSKSLAVLAVIFDLEGFTEFTKQVDPQLCIPNFIWDFYQWLFKSIKRRVTDEENSDRLWAELPFYSKFLGDGALFLWKIDIKKIEGIKSNLNLKKIQHLLNEHVCNVISIMLDIVNDFEDFYDSVSNKYVDVPRRLRCGIARGNVFSVGDGMDYVGPCINIAARLQKFHGLSFAFSARGVEKKGFHNDYKVQFVKKRVSIRGIGDNELIYILKDEFKELTKDVKINFTKV